MRKFIIALFAALPFLASLPAMSLEPWHDYNRVKAHAQKAAKAKAKKAEKAEARMAKEAPEPPRR